MTRKELIEFVQGLEERIGAAPTPKRSFRVAEAAELADGVLAVRRDTGEWIIFFDKSKKRVCGEPEHLRFIYVEYPDIPADIGLLEDKDMRRSLNDIASSARMLIRQVGRWKKIRWYKKPVSVKY